MNRAVTPYRTPLGDLLERARQRVRGMAEEQRQTAIMNDFKRRRFIDFENI